MKKHLKIFSAVLSLVLAVCTIQAVFFQALAADEDTTTVAYDDEYTYDEATDDEFGLERSTPVSIEIVNADESIPETIEVHSFGKYDMSFWNDVVFLITYKDGYTEYFQSEFYDDGWAKELPKHYAGKPIPIIVPTELIGDTFDIEFCNYHALLEVNSIYVDDISNPELPTTDDMKYNEAISSPDEGAKSTIDEVATPDSKATDSNTKSTNDNAVVATGDVAVAAGVAVVMLIAAAVMVILKRRKSVLN